MTAGPAAGRWWTGMTKRIYPERTLVMPTTTAIPAPRLIGVDGLGALIEALVADGYQVIGPAVQDGAIVLRDLSSAAELPSGWGVELEPGGYRLRRRDDTAAFGHAAGPQSWKRFLHPPRERLWSAARTAAGFEVAEDGDEPPRYAFLGVRPCDLRAIEIQDRVLGQPGSRYAQRRSGAFIIAVNCTEPGETCFCASMSAGPGTDGSGFDLALTELPGETGHRFLVDTGSQRGAEVLGRVPSEAADDATLREARGEVEAAADQMGRQMKAGGLRELMAAVEAADKPVGGLTVEPDALGPGLREWFGSLGRYPVKAAAFDTRMLGPAVLTGRASKGWPGCCARTVSMWPRSRRASWSPSRTGSSSTRPPGPGSGGSKLAARLAPS